VGDTSYTCAFNGTDSSLLQIKSHINGMSNQSYYVIGRIMIIICETLMLSQITSREASIQRASLPLHQSHFPLPAYRQAET
jgi:hypothetical protein